MSEIIEPSDQARFHEALREAFSANAAGVDEEALGLGNIEFDANDVTHQALLKLHQIYTLQAIDLDEAHNRATVLEERLVSETHRADTDAMTGLLRKEPFLSAVTQALAHRRSTDPPGSGVLAMVDGDHFKDINDTYGHLNGDRALKFWAGELLEGIRARNGDLAGRFGGEEFFLFFPGKHLHEAVSIMDRMRQDLGAVTMRDLILETDGEDGILPEWNEEGLDRPRTVSIGLTTVTDPSELERALARADAALYESKHGGRDRISVNTIGDADGIPYPIRYTILRHDEPHPEELAPPEDY